MRISLCKISTWAICSLAVAAILGCSEEPAPRQPITETRHLAPGELPEATGLTTAQRLGLARPDGHPAMMSPGDMPMATGEASAAVAGAEAAGPAPLAWKTPPGWEELPPTQFRNPNFRVANQPEVECYLTVLPGGAGGLLPNLNRWRAQMNAAPLSEDEAAALPTKDLLGEPGAFMTLTGEYGGMGQQPAKEGYMMAALAAIHGGTGYFVKMTGPEAAVQQELPNFDLFVASLTEAAPEQPAAAEPAPMATANTGAMTPDPSTPGSDAAGGITWDVPAGWQRGPDKPMRLATYTFGPSNEGECRVYVFPDMAGGLVENVNRWRAQMGLPPQSPEEIDALPTLPVLGREATYLELEGDFTDMQAPTKPGQTMLGLICPLEAQGLFVKLTGPKEVVAGQVDAFKSFVTSMR